MYELGSFNDLKAYDLYDPSQIATPSSFAFGVLLPETIEELEWGSADDEYLSYFLADGDIETMPPYRGIRISLGFSPTALDGTDQLYDDDENDQGLFARLTEVGIPEYPNKIIIEIVVPMTQKQYSSQDENVLYSWLYELLRAEFYALTEAG